MGRDFTTSDTWLERAEALTQGGFGPLNRFPVYPSTWCCWFSPRVLADIHTCIWNGIDTAGGSWAPSLWVAGLSTNHPWLGRIRGSGGTSDVISADDGRGMEVGGWYHGLTTFNNPTLRACYSDGGHRGINTTSNVPSASLYNRFAIGMLRDSSPGHPAQGVAAEVGVWNVVLSELEIQQLSQWRWAPTMVRKTNLIFYRSFRFPDHEYDPPDDLAGTLVDPRFTLTNVGTIFGRHPPGMVYPNARTRRIAVLSPTADPDATTTTVQIQLNAPVKPQAKTPAVDQPHPLATGLVSAWLFNSPNRTVMDVVGSADLSLSGTTEWVGRPDGYALRQDETDDLAVVAAVHPSLKLGLPITLVAVCYPNGIPAEESTFFGMTFNDADSTPFQSYALMLVNRQIKLAGNTGGSFFQVLSTENWADHYGERIVVVGTFTRTAVTGYLNGRQIVQSVSTRVDPTYSATSSFGTGPLGVNRLRGNDFAAGMVYRRELSQTEIAVLSVDPYAAFRRGRVQLYHAGVSVISAGEIAAAATSFDNRPFKPDTIFVPSS